MKRLQNRIGLGETHLPDERKRPMVRDEEPALVGAGAPLPPPRALPAHDPGHPAPDADCGGPTTRIRVPRDAEDTTRAPAGDVPPNPAPNEAPTTRFAAARNAMRSAVTGATEAIRPSSPPPAAGEREIESWLGDLRNPNKAAPQPHSQPSSDPTRSMQPGGETAEATTAIPAQTDEGDSSEAATRAIPIAKKGPADTEAATEKLNSRGARGGEGTESTDKPSRRGGGVSAQDLLRREGRY